MWHCVQNGEGGVPPVNRNTHVRENVLNVTLTRDDECPTNGNEELGLREAREEDYDNAFGNIDINVTTLVVEIALRTIYPSSDGLLKTLMRTVLQGTR